MAERDWIAWHSEYDDPASSLARRLVCVRAYFRRALDLVEGEGPTRLNVVSICAGDGRDVLPVIAERARPRPMSITLIELDGLLVERARQSARNVPARVYVRQADAGEAATYADLPRASIVLACGVFGNIGLVDASITIRFLPTLLAPDGIVIWTRGRPDHGNDQSQQIRGLFRKVGFHELAFTAPEDARFRVGMSRLRLHADPEFDPPGRIFTFIT